MLYEPGKLNIFLSVVEEGAKVELNQTPALEIVDFNGQFWDGSSFQPTSQSLSPVYDVSSGYYIYKDANLVTVGSYIANWTGVDNSLTAFDYSEGFTISHAVAPTANEIALETDSVLSSNHGAGSWETASIPADSVQINYDVDFTVSTNPAIPIVKGDSFTVSGTIAENATGWTAVGRLRDQYDSSIEATPTIEIVPGRNQSEVFATFAAGDTDSFSDKARFEIQFSFGNPVQNLSVQKTLDFRNQIIAD